MRRCYRGFGGASAFHLWDRGFDSRCGLAHDTYVKGVSQLSTDSDKVGWDKLQTYPSNVAVLRDQTFITWLPEAPLKSLQLDQVEPLNYK